MLYTGVFSRSFYFEQKKVANDLDLLKMHPCVNFLNKKNHEKITRCIRDIFESLTCFF